MDRPGAKVHENPRIFKLVEFFGETPLEEITEAAISRYEASRGGVKPSTLNREVRTPISAILRFAASLNGGTPPEIRRHPTQLPSVRWIPDDAPARALKAASGFAYLEPLIVFLFYTGSRLNEAITLDWSDVALDRGREHVTFYDAKGGTDSVPLPPIAVRYLARTPKAKREGAVFRKENGDPYAEYIRVRIRGLSRTPSGATLPRLREAMAAAGLKGLGIKHPWRHWYVSHIAAQEGLAVAGKLARHKSVQTTKRYSHFAPDHLAAAVKNLPTSKPRKKRKA